MAGLDPSAIRLLQGGGAGMAQMVPRDVLEAQMQHQETVQNVNIAFSIANSDTVLKHAIDGSDNAKEIITRALVVLVAYMRDVKINGQELFAASDETAAAGGTEPGDHSPGA